MKLEEVTAQLRPRSPWESVDLGFALVRRHFKKLLLAWCLTVVPLWALLLTSALWIPLGYVLLAVWWLKPIYDRVPLFILSRSLFGATPTLREVLRAWPGMIFRDFPRLMILRVPWLIVSPRFAWARSLLLPIVDLERQKGSGFRQRQKVLLQQAGGPAAGLAFFCGLYEIILVLGLLTLGAMVSVDPMGAMELGRQFTDLAFRREMPGWLMLSLVGGYLVSITMVEMFFVGGGFGLYLNTRTHLEGWDVEIVFRRLAKRLAKTAAAVLGVGLVCLGPSPAWAAVEKEDPVKAGAKYRETEVIQQVKSHEDFKVQTVKERVEDPSSASSSSGSRSSWSGFAGMEALGSVLFYLVIVAGVLFLMYLIYQNRHLFRRGARQAPVPKALPRTLMGMDITPDSLPADIVGAARARWAAGDARGALSLLYRGALVWLVHVAQLPVRESDTEGDCLQHTGQLGEALPRDYFAALTQEWVSVAYAEREPVPMAMERLLGQWPFAPQGRRAS